MLSMYKVCMHLNIFTTQDDWFGGDILVRLNEFERNKKERITRSFPLLWEVLKTI